MQRQLYYTIKHVQGQELIARVNQNQLAAAAGSQAESAVFDADFVATLRPGKATGGDALSCEACDGSSVFAAKLINI